jgi:sulfur relay (sulfurtransferase) complex TusBCD TusD component (DsrE family)
MGLLNARSRTEQISFVRSIKHCLDDRALGIEFCLTLFAAGGAEAALFFFGDGVFNGLLEF